MATAKSRSVLVSSLVVAALGVAACSSSPPRTTVRETQRVIRSSDEVCKQTVVTEQRRERDGDRSRVATTETVCRDR